MVFNLFKDKKKGVSIQSCDGTININGKVYKGNNVCIQADKIIIDGVVQNNEDPLVGPINITIEGNIEKLETVGDVIVHGNVSNVTTTAGDIDVVGDIRGNISTVSGDIRGGGVITGNISTISGDIVGRSK